jgi:hypothetical protein
MITTVSLATIQQTIARAIAFAPRDRSPIERGAALLTTGNIEQLDDVTYRVRSQTDDQISYTVTPNGCGCVGAQRKVTLRCKHDWAVRVLRSAEMQDARGREQAERAAVTADRVALAYARRIGFAA